MGFMRIIYSPRFFDICFTLVGLMCLTVIAIAGGREVPAIAAADDPTKKGLALVAVIIVGAIIACFTTKLDQKCADDLMFAVLTKSALIALMGTILSILFWQLLFQSSFGPMPGQLTLIVIMSCWSLGYFHTRWKGTVA